MCRQLNERKYQELLCLSFCLAELIIDVGDIFQVGSHSRSQVLEFLSERNILSAKDNIGGGSIDVKGMHGTNCHQYKSTLNMHEKAEPIGNSWCPLCP
jgi:hypothetical protein